MRIEHVHVVIFDGTPNRPMGRMLFGPESAAVEPATPDLEYGTATKRLRAHSQALRDWLTVHQIAEIINLSASQASSPVNTLVHAGVMEREVINHAGGRRGGPQRYRWTR